MKLLTDTSVFLKVLEGGQKPSAQHRQYITDPANEKWISQFSLMELVIKMKIGKLPQITLTPEDILKQALADGFLLLTVSIAQIFAYNKLPLLQDHRDPFDRFIISAAIVENMKIITTDAKFHLYKDYVELL